MRRAVSGAIVGVFLLTTVAVGAAFAHNFAADTSLTIAKVPSGATQAGAKVLIYGRLRSGNASCRTNKVVKLMRVRPGPDKLLARDRTDAEGEYLFVRNPGRDQTVYTRFSGTFNTSYGHSHRCRSDRSRSLFVNVIR
jgi:hypothetical protein